MKGSIPNEIMSTEDAKLEKLGITRDQGKKSSDDKIILFHGSALNMKIIGEIYSEMCKIQDKLDPNGLGAELIADYLVEIREAGKVTDEITKKYHAFQWKGNDKIKLEGNNISLEIFGYIYSELCKIQDILHPYGRGARYLADYLEDIRKNGCLNEEIKRRYKV